MLDPKLLREDPESVRQATRVKRIGSPELVDAWIAADDRRKASQGRADALRAEQNRLGPEIGRLKRELKGGTSPELEQVQQQATAIKQQQQSAAEEQSAAETEAAAIMLQLPAIPDPAWPVGPDESANQVVRTWHAPSRPPVPLADGRRDHVTLGTSLGILDFDRGVKIAGSRSYVVRGAGALLYNAVLRMAMDRLVERGFVPAVVPLLVTEHCMTGTGYFPAGREQAYVTQDSSVLVGTSEVPLVGMFAGEILDEASLPLRLCAMSTCFRREAGAAGKDTAGLYRVHQFDKVEQVIIHRADEEEHTAIHEQIMANTESVLQDLGLAYRVVKNSTGDMGQGKWRMYDIETWMPSRNAYGETHSGSALRDFQSRRLNIRYRPAADRKAPPLHCYTLNNTTAACPRLLIAILEQYQTLDGGVEVPPALHKYMNGLTRLEAPV